MPDLSPADALVTCERALRQLFAHAFQAAYGRDWLSSVATPDKIAKWKRIQVNEHKRRSPRGVAGVPTDALAYAEFSDLCEIAEQHWQPLEDALGVMDETLPLLARFELLRNTVAHSRQPLRFEAELLSGIAGEIRNRVTNYMTAQDPSGDHYPRIESVTDSFGRSWPGKEGLGPWATGEAVRVNVGDVITFDCAGTDAQGRELRWLLRTYSTMLVDQAVGDRVALRWVVGVQDVQDDHMVRITLQSDGRFHRQGDYDQMVHFPYHVVPPASS